MHAPVIGHANYLSRLGRNARLNRLGDTSAGQEDFANFQLDFARQSLLREAQSVEIKAVSVKPGVFSGTATIGNMNLGEAASLCSWLGDSESACRKTRRKMDAFHIWGVQLLVEVIGPVQKRPNGGSLLKSTCQRLPEWTIHTLTCCAMFVFRVQFVKLT